MTFSKVLLGVTGVLFAAYGLWCAVDPGVVAGYSGLAYPTAGAETEARAMYGGLQTGLGLFLLYAAGNPSARIPALLLTLLGVGSLAICRGIGLAVGGADAYNVGAVIYEALTAALAAVAYRREQQPGAAAATS